MQYKLFCFSWKRKGRCNNYQERAVKSAGAGSTMKSRSLKEGGNMEVLLTRRGGGRGGVGICLTNENAYFFLFDLIWTKHDLYAIKI